MNPMHDPARRSARRKRARCDLRNDADLRITIIGKKPTSRY